MARAPRRREYEHRARATSSRVGIDFDPQRLRGGAHVHLFQFHQDEDSPLVLVHFGSDEIDRLAFHKDCLAAATRAPVVVGNAQYDGEQPRP
jgi:hypothetical protein